MRAFLFLPFFSLSPFSLFLFYLFSLSLPSQKLKEPSCAHSSLSHIPRLPVPSKDQQSKDLGRYCTSTLESNNAQPNAGPVISLRLCRDIESRQSSQTAWGLSIVICNGSLPQTESEYHASAQPVETALYCCLYPGKKSSVFRWVEFGTSENDVHGELAR